MIGCASHARGRRGGFTLPEVLAALVLISIVMPVAMRGISTSLSAASHARYMTEAAVLGEMKLNELLVYKEWLTTASGDFAPDWPQYSWKCESQARDFGLTEYVLEVLWTEAGQERSLRIATLVYDDQASVLQ